jgi:protein required for attachment to host cells
MANWVLIADAYHAEIWVQEDHMLLEKECVLIPSVHHRFNREVGSDRPGRTNSSNDARRSSIEPHTDSIETEHRNFAREVTNFLSNALSNNNFKRLAIIAAPKMLGYLRDVRDKKLADVVVGEVAKDLIKSPASEKLAQINAILT